MAVRKSFCAAVLSLAAIVVVGCGDDLFVSPAGGAPPALGLSYSLAGEFSADVVAAYDAVDRARIRVSGPGVALDTVLVFEPATETRVALVLGSAQDGQAYQVDVELRRGTDPLFHGETTATVHAGRTTEAAVPLQPLAADLLLPDSVPLMQVIGDTVVLNAFAVFSTGDTIPGAPVTWSSSNEAVATVDAAGRVVPRADGSAVITARSGNASGSVTINVLETPARLVRVCATGTGRTFASVAMAVDSVASGGTIRFCTGEFIADGLVIDRPLVLEAEAGATVTIRPDTASIAFHLQHPAGTTTIRGLNFVSGRLAAVHGSQYADIVIENTNVQNVGNAARGLQFVGTTESGSVTVRNVEVTGGQTGVFFHGPAQFHVIDSRFGGQIFSGIQYQGGATGSIVQNTVNECGQWGCIRVAQAGEVIVTGNTLRSTKRDADFGNGSGVHYGIVIGSPSARVENNSITGIGAPSDPSLGSTYPFDGAGILVMNTPLGPTRAIVTGNVISNASWGIESATASDTTAGTHTEGSDNVIRDVHTVLATWRQGTMVMRRNDFAGYVTPFFDEGFRPGDATCNWWGTASGPQNTNVDPAVYTPYATAPIANTTTECPPAGTGSLSGNVVNASTGEPIAGATVELLQGGAVVAGTVTSATGAYALSQLSEGTYTVRIVASGFVDFATDMTIGSGEAVTRTFAVPPARTGDQVSIVLTWGATPQDLDSHLEVPASDTSAAQTVAFFNPGSATSYPFATLDIDDTDGFGPETIVIEQQLTGTYTYRVHNFSGEAPLSASGATVEVYRGATRIGTFTVPSGSGDMWTVFSLNGTTLTPINQMSDSGSGLRAAGTVPAGKSK